MSYCLSKSCHPQSSFVILLFSRPQTRTDPAVLDSCGCCTLQSPCSPCYPKPLTLNRCPSCDVQSCMRICIAPNWPRVPRKRNPKSSLLQLHSLCSPTSLWHLQPAVPVSAGAARAPALLPSNTNSHKANSLSQQPYRLKAPPKTT